MWIVKLALNRPYTFVVMALLIVILGGLSIFSMPTDIFPEIDLPVASVIWAYNGMAPEDMEKRIVSSTERAITTTVNDVEHIESQSMPGYGVIRVYFHPTVKIDMAIAQLTAITGSITRVPFTRTVNSPDLARSRNKSIASGSARRSPMLVMPC